MSLAHKFKLIFFSPAPNTRAVLDHLFDTFPAHVGKIGNYQRCAFLTRSTGKRVTRLNYWCVKYRATQGQFAPMADANPTIGQPGKLEQVEEDRVEVLVVGDRVREVIAALKEVHPYEEVAYDVYRLEDY